MSNGVNILHSERLFKKEFSGLKNITLEEWKEIIPRVQKRALDGRDSVVLLDERPLDAKRLKLGINRYASQVQSIRLAGGM